MGPSGGKGGQPLTGHLPTLVTAEGKIDMQEAHDPEVLPHMYEQQGMDRLFPILDAPLPRPNFEDWDHDGIHKGCRVRGKGQDKPRCGESTRLLGEPLENGRLVASY